MPAKTLKSRISRIAPRALLGISILSAGCSSREAPEAETIVPVQVADVQRAAVVRTIAAEGILFPLTQSAVTPKISAPVREFRVNRGDHVQKGQLLAVLENRDLTAAAVESKGLYRQAEAAYQSTTAASLPEEIEKAKLDLQSAREALDAAEKLYHSRQELYREGAIARRLVDEADVAFVQAKSQRDIASKHLDALQNVGSQAQINGAEGQLEAAKGRYQGAEAQLLYSQITSPLDGVVADRPLYAGEMASPGSPLLTIMDISKVIARANVPIGQLKYLKVGNSSTVTGSDGLSCPAKVTVVSPAVDPNSTTAEVWVTADNPKEGLKPGETVRVTVVTDRIDDATVIPTAALLPSEEGFDTVMVVDAGSRAHERRIRVGIREVDRVQVLEGLQPGEKVITVGGLGLEENAKVLIQAAGNHE